MDRKLSGFLGVVDGYSLPCLPRGSVPEGGVQAVLIVEHHDVVEEVAVSFLRSTEMLEGNRFRFERMEKCRIGGSNLLATIQRIVGPVETADRSQRQSSQCSQP